MLNTVLQTTQQYKTPLKLTVVATGSMRYFKDSNGNRVALTHVAVADETMATKLKLYGEKYTALMEPNALVLLTNYYSAKTHITVRADSSVFRTGGTMNIPEDIRKAAYEMIHPPAPPIISVSDARNSPVKSPPQAVSIQGRISQVSQPLPFSTPAEGTTRPHSPGSKTSRAQNGPVNNSISFHPIVE